MKFFDEIRPRRKRRGPTLRKLFAELRVVKSVLIRKGHAQAVVRWLPGAGFVFSESGFLVRANDSDAQLRRIAREVQGYA